MKRYILLILVVMLALVLVPTAAQDEPPRQGIRPDAPPYAIRGPYAVGTMELVIEPDSDRPLVTTAWYPAVMPQGMGAWEPEIFYTLFTAAPNMTARGHALVDAEPNTTDGPYPLIIFSHGNFFTRLAAPYMMEHLASYGFVVMAVDHFGNVILDGGDMSMWYSFLYYRPIDITRTIDGAEALNAGDGILSGMIDAEYVGVTGGSYGAYTALASGGARFSIDHFNSMCALAPINDINCANFSENLDTFIALAGLDSAPEGLMPSWGDPRVDAVLPMSPGFISAEGAQAVTVPTMLMLGGADPIVPNETTGYPIWENLGSSKTLVEFMDGGHAYAAFKCTDVPWAGFVWWCADPVWDMDRAHDLVDHFATAFFLSQLKGDTDAAAALAPDAVNFVGIHYETTGY